MVSAGTSAAHLALLPDHSWAPLACVLVYCVLPSGEVVNDAVELPVVRTFANKVGGAGSDPLRRSQTTSDL